MVNKRIREIRKSKGLSQKDLAAKLYVSPQAVSKWEKGTSTPNPDAIVSIAEIFGVSTDYLLGYNLKGEKTLTPESGSELDESDRQVAVILKDLSVEQKEGLLAFLRVMIPKSQSSPASAQEKED